MSINGNDYDHGSSSMRASRDETSLRAISTTNKGLEIGCSCLCQSKFVTLRLINSFSNFFLHIS